MDHTLLAEVAQAPLHGRDRCHAEQVDLFHGHRLADFLLVSDGVHEVEVLHGAEEVQVLSFERAHCAQLGKNRHSGRLSAWTRAANTAQWRVARSWPRPA